MWGAAQLLRAIPSSLQREGLEQLRVYESRDERRCIPEYEYFTTRPTCPLRALEREAEEGDERRPRTQCVVPCRPIVSRWYRMPNLAVPRKHAAGLVRQQPGRLGGQGPLDFKAALHGRCEGTNLSRELCS